jgi:hypothetical protein
MLSHVVRRAVQVTAEQLAKLQVLEKQAEAFDKLHYEMPFWGFVILGVTGFAFLILASAIEYTIRLLIFNLAIIESPKSTASQRYTLLLDDDAPDAPLEKKKKEEEFVDIEVDTVETSDKPMTGSIRKTISHLTSIGGFRARWRGIRAFALYSILMTLINSVFTGFPLFGPLGSPIVGSLVAGMATARLHCAWTHKTITMPSNKKLYERFVTRKQHLQLLAPNAIKILAVEITCLATVLISIYSFNQISDMMRIENPNKLLGAVLAFAPLATLVTGFLFAVLPSYVVLVRVEASMLPEEEETIVPMDRTFGGLLMAASDKLTIRSAWKSFNGTGRVVKLYLKFFLISIALSVFVSHVLFVELWAIMGDKLVVLLTSLRAGLEIQATVGY